MCGDLAYRATIGIINKPNINCCPCQLKPHPTSTVVIICKIKTPITLNPYPPTPPNKEVPQTTTAAIVKNKYVSPTPIKPPPLQPKSNAPVRDAKKPLIT